MFGLVDSLYYLALTKACTSLFTRESMKRSFDAFVWSAKIVTEEIRQRTDVPETVKRDMIVEAERLQCEIKHFCLIGGLDMKNMVRFAKHLVWNADGGVDVAKTCTSVVESGEDFDGSEKIVVASMICDETFLRRTCAKFGYALENPEDFFYYHLKHCNPFAVKYFWGPDTARDLEFFLLRWNERVARYLFANCGAENVHFLVLFSLNYYQKRNRFEAFEKDFWNELDRAVQLRFLESFVEDVFQNVFCRYNDEEILFFAARLTATQQKLLLERLTEAFDVLNLDDLATGLLRICRKDVAEEWIAEHANDDNSLSDFIFNYLSKEKKM